MTQIKQRFGVTLWGGGPRRSWEDPRTRRVLDAVRPDIVQIHSDPLVLADGGHKIADQIRAAYPGVEIYYAVQGDGYLPHPGDEWAKCARACVAHGINTLVLDCEGGWARLDDPTAAAREAVGMVRAAAPSLRLAHTYVDDPVSIVRPVDPPRTKAHYAERKAKGLADTRGARAGGVGRFPQSALTGAGSPVTVWQPQVYLGNEGVSWIGHAEDRWGRHVISSSTAVRLGVLRPDIVRHLYLQLHHTPPAEVVELVELSAAAGYTEVHAWCAPVRVDDLTLPGYLVAALLAHAGLTLAQHRAEHGIDPATDLDLAQTLRAFGRDVPHIS